MHRIFTIAVLAILPFPIALGASAAVDGADRIEEDWQLIISTPDAALTCPQITTLMQLDSEPTSPVMIFNLNYRENPSFSAGGLQVKILENDQTRATSTQRSSQLQTNNETITWTQRLQLSEGVLRFKVVTGRSTTWGNFGSDDDDDDSDHLAVALTTSHATLADYSPAVSVQNSGPGFGSNRVSSMTLLGVRYYQGNMLLSTDSTPRSVSLSN